MRRTACLFAFALLLSLTSGSPQSGITHASVRRPAADCDLRVLPLPIQPANQAAEVGIALAADGSHAFAASPDGGSVVKLDTASGQVLALAHQQFPVTSIEASPNGALLAVVSGPQGVIAIHRTSDLEPLGFLVAQPGLAAAAFSSDSSRLYTVSGPAQMLQVIDIGARAVVGELPLHFIPSDVASIGDGSEIAISLADATQVLVLDASMLMPRITIPVPPGARHLVYRPDAQGAQLIVTSALSDTITIADVASGNVLATLQTTDPGEIALTPALQGLIFVSRSGGARIDVIDADPLSPLFARRVATIFNEADARGMALAETSGLFVAHSGDGSALITLPAACIAGAPHASSIAPDHGVPGTMIEVTGNFAGHHQPLPGSLAALFMQDDTAPVLPLGRPINPTATSFKVEVPLEAPLGDLQVWLSASSEPSVQRGLFIATFASTFRAIDVITALQELANLLSQLAGDPTLSTEARNDLLEAVASLNRAIALLRDKGSARGGLEELITALGHVLQAKNAGATVGNAAGLLVEAAQFLVFRKVDAARRRLGSEDPEVQTLLQLFQTARDLHLQGNALAALQGFASALEQFAVLRERACKFTEPQALALLSETIPSLVRLIDDARNEGADHAALTKRRLKLFGDLRADLGEGADGTLVDTAVGEFASLRGDRGMKALKRAQHTLGRLAHEGADVGALQTDLFGVALGFVDAVARTVEGNVGEFDEDVTAARADMARADENDDVRPLIAALSPLMPCLFVPELLKPCHATAQIQSVDGICVHMEGDPPAPTSASTSVIKTKVGLDSPDEFGLFILTAESPGAQRKLALVVAALRKPGVYQDPWDGKDASGAIVVEPGPIFKVRLRYICLLGSAPPTPGHAASAIGDLQVADDNGLIVTPSQAAVCAGESVKFKATTCVEGNPGADVSDAATWSVDPTSIGVFAGPVFTSAATTSSQRGMVRATYAGKSGRASVTVLPDGGGMVPAKAVLCIGDQLDLNVFQCPGTSPNDQLADGSLTWSSSDEAVATVNGSGIVTATGFGTATITATGEAGTFTAQITVDDFDDIFVTSAPATLCPGETGVFSVKVLCDGQPAVGVDVRFSSAPGGTVGYVDPNGGAIVDSLVVATGGGGTASLTVVVKTNPTKPTDIRLKAEAQSAAGEGLTAFSNMVADKLTITISGVPSLMCVGEEADMKVTLACAGAPPSTDLDVTLSSSGILFDGSPSLTAKAVGGVLNVTIKATAPSLSVNGTVIQATSVAGASANVSLTVAQLTLHTPTFIPLGEEVPLAQQLEPSDLAGTLSLRIQTTGRGRPSIIVNNSVVNPGTMAPMDVLITINASDSVRLSGRMSSLAQEDITITAILQQDTHCAAIRKTAVGAQLEWVAEQFKPLIEAEGDRSFDGFWEVVVSARLMTENIDLDGQTSRVALSDRGIRFKRTATNDGTQLLGVASTIEGLETASPSNPTAVTGPGGRVFLRLRVDATNEAASLGNVLGLLVGVSWNSGPISEALFDAFLTHSCII